MGKRVSDRGVDWVSHVFLFYVTSRVCPITSSNDTTSSSHETINLSSHDNMLSSHETIYVFQSTDLHKEGDRQ